MIRAGTRPTARFPTWLLQRLSGLLLGPVIFLHIWVEGATANALLGSLLLLLIVTHVAFAFLRMAAERPVKAPTAARTLVLAVGLVVLLLGAAVVGSLAGA